MEICINLHFLLLIIWKFGQKLDGNLTTVLEERERECVCGQGVCVDSLAIAWHASHCLLVWATTPPAVLFGVWLCCLVGGQLVVLLVWLMYKKSVKQSVCSSEAGFPHEQKKKVCSPSTWSLHIMVEVNVLFPHCVCASSARHWAP